MMGSAVEDEISALFGQHGTPLPDGSGVPVSAP